MKPRIELMMDRVHFTPTDQGPNAEGLPYSTHEGVMDLFGHKLRVYRLSDGHTIFHADDFNAFLASGLGVEPPKP